MAHGSEVGMGFNIERTNKPFVVKSPYKPSGDQPKAIEELAERIENGENDVVLMGATGTGKTSSHPGCQTTRNGKTRCVVAKVGN